jgi:hypothetical protein
MTQHQEALPVNQSSRGIDRVAVTFDEPNLVANAGLLLVATVVKRLGLEALINAFVRIPSKRGGFAPGRKVLTLVHAMVAGASHIDHADVLRAGATEKVLSHRVMAPSTLGTFLRSFTFGHLRQLDAVIGEAICRAWSAMTLPRRMVIDLDSTVCEVSGKKKVGAAYGYSKVLGLHPLLATRTDTGEVLHARMRKGSANTQRGARRFIEELVARVRRAGATGQLVLRMDSGSASSGRCRSPSLRLASGSRAPFPGHWAQGWPSLDASRWTDQPPRRPNASRAPSGIPYPRACGVRRGRSPRFASFLTNRQFSRSLAVATLGIWRYLGTPERPSMRALCMRSSTAPCRTFMPRLIVSSVRTRRART